MANVLLNSVSKEYPGGVKAVIDASLEIADREFVVLVGPSGCGKSTTLRMIAGLEDITSGTISIGGNVVNNVPPKDRNVAMVFQNYALYPHMTVFENMAFGLKLRRFNAGEIKTRVDEAARILGLTELLARKPKELSGGQSQRVAVGRAIVRKPAAFLFDEPLSNLDAKLRVDMRVELNRLHHSLATTMIYVTHDQVEAMTLADRIVIMNHAVIQQVASPLNLYDQPFNQYVASFIGSPPMNFLSGTLAGTAGGLLFDDGAGVKIPLSENIEKKVGAFIGQPIKLGIRPEMISDRSSAHDWPSATPVTAKVDVVEALGDHLTVYFSNAKNNFIGKLDAHVPAVPGKSMEIVFNASKVHVFDATTGNNLTCAVTRYEPPNFAELPNGSPEPRT
ncbi:MAG TPA: sn-glycerol-3-phosphate ABC transporter ATP-binding protein UgpC [Planctomycetota bacterium]|nr:sn-glycerol-3-phosphate ABC transporter ATP-binding protein UgpC [Planctomycetota bacterium]